MHSLTGSWESGAELYWCRQAATLALCGEKARLSSWSRKPLWVLGRGAKAVCQRQWGPSSFSQHKQQASKIQGHRVSGTFWGGKEGCPGVCSTEVASTAPYWVWQTWIPGGVHNLALPVWLSPDTRSLDTHKLRQYEPALERSSWSGTQCLFSGWRGELGPGRKGPGTGCSPLSTSRLASPGEATSLNRVFKEGGLTLA